MDLPIQRLRDNCRNFPVYIRFFVKIMKFSVHAINCCAQKWFLESILKWCHRLIHRLACAAFVCTQTLSTKPTLSGMITYICCSQLRTALN